MCDGSTKGIVSAGLLVMAFFVLTATRAQGQAQGQATQTAADLDAATRTQLIENVLKRIKDLYVFPETAKEMESAIRARVQKGEYDKLTNAAAFVQKLTDDLHAVKLDKHLWVGYTDKPQPQSGGPGGGVGPEAAMRRDGPRNNFGFPKAEVLPGNIGYIDIRLFYDPEVAAEKATAAMNFLSNTDALIIDLRMNGGGSGEMVAFVLSYLFGPEPVLVNTAYFRPENKTFESWTLKDVPGKRYAKDVYVLTSDLTFSAGEEFAYDLKTQKRATLVGQTTRGGANPNAFIRLDDKFFMSIPIGRAINPITKTNWEGVGVKPDVEVPKELALKTAHLLALRKVLEKSTDEEYRARLRQTIDALQKELGEAREGKKSFS